MKTTQEKLTQGRNTKEGGYEQPKLFQCVKCWLIKKRKYIGGFQSLNKLTGPVHPVCKRCLKPPEVVPTPHF